MEWEYKFNFKNDKCIIEHTKRNMPQIYVPVVGRRMFLVNILYLFDFL